MCDFSTKLIAWHDGELPDDEAAAIEQHVHVCSECRNRLGAYRKVSGMVNAYCDAALASTTRGAVLANWAPVLGAAASVAVLLILFASTRTERTVPRASTVALPATSAAAAPAAIEKAVHPLVSQKVYKHSVAALTLTQDAQNANAARMPAEPAIQIAIPGEAIFPPGALPPGVDFVADVSIAADGSAQRLRLRPQLASFQGGPNQ
jgi:hypothetical protein